MGTSGGRLEMTTHQMRIWNLVGALKPEPSDREINLAGL